MICSYHSVLAKKIRWCTVSEPEQRKCAELAKNLVTVLPPDDVAAFARVSCVRASSTIDCIDRIRVSLPENPSKVCAIGEKYFNIEANVFLEGIGENKPIFKVGSIQIKGENW